MSDENNVEIRIQASQMVRYDQTVTMTRRQWERIKALDEERRVQELAVWLDLSDVSDADDIEDDVDAFVVDGDDKMVKPRDGIE
jgi:hypothetical protein